MFFVESLKVCFCLKALLFVCYSEILDHLNNNNDKKFLHLNPALENMKDEMMKFVSKVDPVFTSNNESQCNGLSTEEG